MRRLLGVERHEWQFSALCGGRFEQFLALAAKVTFEHSERTFTRDFRFPGGCSFYFMSVTQSAVRAVWLSGLYRRVFWVELGLGLAAFWCGSWFRENRFLGGFWSDEDLCRR